MSDKKLPLICVVGPTGSGKTALAIAISKRINGEIVSADSMQIYKYISIATAKATASEQAEVPHHLIDFLEPSQLFSVADYAFKARQAMADIYSRGKIPVLTGGTGLYIRAITENLQFMQDKPDQEYRDFLFDLAKKEGNQAVYELWVEVDPESAKGTHANNITRVVRGLEAYKLTGMTAQQRDDFSRSVPSPYKSIQLGISFDDRATLYDRINKRVDIMMQDGLLDEIKSLQDKEFSQTAMQAIGYKEFAPYFSGETDLKPCVDLIKQQSRRYAKRQLTWFRHQNNVRWISYDKFNNIEDLTEEAVGYIKEEFDDINII